MLKIKDNVDLKVLKKYGFNYLDEEDICIVDNVFWLGTLKQRIIFKMGVNKITREIDYFDIDLDDFLNVLYDLIQDDLVEKV